MNTKVKILFCPQFEPFQPYLSLPYLKSLLRIYGIDSHCYDANIDFYHWLFKTKSALNDVSTSKNHFIENNLDDAVSTLLNGTEIVTEYRFAINLIEEFLAVVSPENIRLSLSGMEIKNKYSSNDLKEIVFSDENIFTEFFTAHKDDILGNSDVNYYFFSLVVLDQLGASLSIAREIKKVKPSAKVVFGGAMISRFYKRLINIDWLREIVDFLEPGEAYKIIPKIFQLPDVYSGHVSPDFSDIKLEKYLSPNVVLPYLVAHGCKWGKCTFCSHHLSYEGYRSSSMEQVVLDLSKLKQEYNVDYISFCDEYLTHFQLEELAASLHQLGINIKWSTFVRAESKFKDYEFTKKLYSGGCRLLFFGFETVSQRLLRLMKKGNNSSNYLPILDSCKNANIAVRLDIMFGFPTETVEEAQRTLDFIIDNKKIIDTPFSSLPIAVFELREDIPVFKELDEYGLVVKALSRGDLDEQYDFAYPDGTDNLSQETWRNQVINFMKQEMDTEIICPYNKTHQLIFKSLYDLGKIKLPLVDFDSVDNSEFEFYFSKGINIINKDGELFLENYATSSQLKIANELKHFVLNLPKGITSQEIFRGNTKQERKLFLKLIRFLVQYDYIQIRRIEATNN